MSAFAERLGAGAVLCCAALMLANTCLRHRAILGLFCALLAASLAVAAPLGLVDDPAQLLVGSVIATAIGTLLLLLGSAVERLVEDAPRECLTSVQQRKVRRPCD